MIGYEKGVIRGNDNSRTNGALVNIALATGNIGREGSGKVHHVWACDHSKTTLNATEFKRVYNRRTSMVKEAMDAAAGKTRAELVDAIVAAVDAGGLFSVNVDIMAPADLDELGVGQGDLVEVFSDDGATQAMAYPTATARPKETFMLFASPAGLQGNVINAGVNELVLPNSKQTWADIRKLSDAPPSVQGMSFKSWEHEPGA